MITLAVVAESLVRMELSKMRDYGKFSGEEVDRYWHSELALVIADDQDIRAACDHFVRRTSEHPSLAEFLAKAREIRQTRERESRECAAAIDVPALMPRSEATRQEGLRKFKDLMRDDRQRRRIPLTEAVDLEQQAKVKAQIDQLREGM